MDKKLCLMLSRNEELILNAVSRQERYGLDLIDAIATASGGLIKLGFGAIYPALNRLEQKGLVDSRWEEEAADGGGARRKYYRANDLGQKCLEYRRQFLEELNSKS